KAVLTFYLTPDKTLNKELPIEKGVVTVTFSVMNNGPVVATDPAIWLRICNECDYAEEPVGFEKVPGAWPKEREKKLQRILAGTHLPEMSVKVRPESDLSGFEIGMWYTCDNCEPVTFETGQKATIMISKPQQLTSDIQGYRSQ